MKIAFVLDQIIICGGVLIPFQYVRELKKQGYQADIYANGQLEGYAPTKPISDLKEFTNDDVIIAVWWPQCPDLLQYKGRKIQFVQGNDSYNDDSWNKRCLDMRRDVHWEILAVSKYAGEWVGRRNYTIVPNFVDDRFFKDLGIKKDIDILIEGNTEENKNIDETIRIARILGDRVAWFGRETKPTEGIEIITNPYQGQIPVIYQRAKVFLKLSKSEGFCLPILEAMASKCLVVTQDMGGNDFCEFGKNCLQTDNDIDNRQDIIKAGYQTALNHNVKTSTKKLLQYLEN